MKALQSCKDLACIILIEINIHIFTHIQMEPNRRADLEHVSNVLRSLSLFSVFNNISF